MDPSDLQELFQEASANIVQISSSGESAWALPCPRPGCQVCCRGQDGVWCWVGPLGCPLPSRATQHRRRGWGEPSAVVSGRAMTLAGAPSAPISLPRHVPVTCPALGGQRVTASPRPAGAGGGGESHAPQGLGRAPHALVAQGSVFAPSPERHQVRECWPREDSSPIPRPREVPWRQLRRAPEPHAGLGPVGACLRGGGREALACWLRQVQGHSSASAPMSLGRGRVGGAPEWRPLVEPRCP